MGETWVVEIFYTEQILSHNIIALQKIVLKSTDIYKVNVIAGLQEAPAKSTKRWIIACRKIFLGLIRWLEVQHLDH